MNFFLGLALFGIFIILAIWAGTFLLGIVSLLISLVFAGINGIWNKVKEIF